MATQIFDASDLTLVELANRVQRYNYPFIFGISYTSSIAPDANNTVGIAIRGVLYAFSYSGKSYRCIGESPSGWSEAFVQKDNFDNRIVGSDKDGWRALQSVSDPYRTRLQIMDSKGYAEIFRSADSGQTWTSLGILASKDDLNDYAFLISDCNAATKNGNYACNNTANAPTEYGILKVETAMSGTWIFQTFRKASDSDSPRVYMRDNINNTGWSQWISK